MYDYVYDMINYVNDEADSVKCVSVDDYWQLFEDYGDIDTLDLLRVDTTLVDDSLSNTLFDYIGWIIFVAGIPWTYWHLVAICTWEAFQNRYGWYF